ncbi:MAG: pyridoxal-phosphate dependent enzyme [Candidatus Babeliales bacterium]|nr:pyridoxal-phosphate dependent enzyme [Candidatus Babeliales bacterium]
MKHRRSLLIVGMLSCFSIIQSAQYAGEALFVHDLSLYVPLSNSILNQLNQLAAPFQKTAKYKKSSTKKLPLFAQFPKLKDKIPYITLCNLPTPVVKLSNLSDFLQVKEIVIKRDDMAGLVLKDGKRLFGGTKLRKLGFEFGQALENGAKSILTSGSAGSNHAVATAACAQYLDLKSFSLLKPQPNSRVVRRNLLLMDYYGSQIQYCPSMEVRKMGAVYTFFRQKEDFGDFPYIIPPGATCPMGLIGIVNAAYELKEQIKNGQLSEPDRIYVPAGTLGTYVGLLLGCKIADIKSKVVGVLVMPDMKPDSTRKLIVQLFNQTSLLLHQFDSSFPALKLDESQIEMLFDYRGTEYGLFTKEGVDALNVLKDKEGIMLDGTYTAKAFAGMLDDIKKNNYHDKRILFWNTFYADDCQSILALDAYKNLPKALHSYFQTDVQPLDKN